MQYCYLGRATVQYLKEKLLFRAAIMTGRHLSTIQSGRQYPAPAGDDSNNHTRDASFQSLPDNPSPPHHHETRRTNSYPPPYTTSAPNSPPPSRPLGFGIVAQARRLEYKERSNRRLMGMRQQSSLRNLFQSPRLSQSERSRTLEETSPLMSNKRDEMMKQRKGSESFDGDAIEIEMQLKEETVTEALVDMFFGQWVSILLIFAPFALASHFLEWAPKYTFWLCFLTMIPLASILGDFTEEAAAHTNQVIGGLVSV